MRPLTNSRIHIDYLRRNEKMAKPLAKALYKEKVCKT